MPEPSDLHVVLGASGGIGNALVRELAARGRRVRAVDRGGTAPVPADVEVRAADVATRDGAAHACADAAVVYHCAQPAYARWRQEFLPMTRAVLHGAATAGARLVLADNLYMYGPVDRPMTEDLPYAATNPKGRVRAEMAELLLAAHRSGAARATMGRAAHRPPVPRAGLPAARPARQARRRQPRPAARAGLFVPPLRQLGETWYQRERPFVMDATRFERAFGPLPATPHDQAVAATLDWFRRRPR